ncbi:MAG: 50S ribosomal protein L35 [Phycisphaeraceae bacterium]|nr:50S ribosomal protein L35 [Phycisphaeraceae bacterium]
MPKLKPHKSLLKRITITARGKVKFKRAGTSHLNSSLTGKRIRRLRGKATAKSADIKRLELMLNRRLTPGDR